MGRTEAIIALLDELVLAGAVVVVAIILAWGLGAISRTTALLLALVAGGFLTIAGYKAAVAQLRRPEAGAEAMVGKTATALEDLDPEGMVLVEGEYWKAHSPQGRIERGSWVRIVGFEGLTLIVEPLEEKESQPPPNNTAPREPVVEGKQAT